MGRDAPQAALDYNRCREANASESAAGDQWATSFLFYAPQAALDYFDKRTAPQAALDYFDEAVKTDASDSAHH